MSGIPGETTPARPEFSIPKGLNVVQMSRSHWGRFNEFWDVAETGKDVRVD